MKRAFLVGYLLGVTSSWTLGYLVLRDSRIVQLRHRDGEWEWRPV